MAVYRRAEHRKLANGVIAMGNTVMAEKVGYKAFRRMLGQSIRGRAPGTFILIWTYDLLFHPIRFTRSMDVALGYSPIR